MKIDFNKTLTQEEKQTLFLLFTQHSKLTHFAENRPFRIKIKVKVKEKEITKMLEVCSMQKIIQKKNKQQDQLSCVIENKRQRRIGFYLHA